MSDTFTYTVTLTNLELASAVLNKRDGMNVEEIAEAIGVTAQEVRDAMKSAIMKTWRAEREARAKIEAAA